MLHWTKISSGPADHIPHTESIRTSAWHTAQLLTRFCSSQHFSKPERVSDGCSLFQHRYLINVAQKKISQSGLIRCPAPTQCQRFTAVGCCPCRKEPLKSVFNLLIYNPHSRPASHEACFSRALAFLL